MISLKALAAGEHMDITFTETFRVPPEYGLERQDVSVAFEGVLTGGKDRCELDGSLSASFAMCCARCLEPVRIKVEAEVRETFRLTDGEEEFLSFAGDEIDLSPAVEMNLLLNIPVKTVCEDGCRGLCPVCGANLNENECGCDRARRDHRLDALRALFQQPE